MKEENTKREPRKEVLIVDDDMVNRLMLGNIIGTDYDVVYAADGKEAYELIRREEGRLSLVLLDLLMPVMTGYELLTLLKSDDTMSRLPVIVLTSEKTAEVESLKLGAVDFIHKPYDAPEVIKARIRRSIELAEGKQIIRATETDDLTGLYNRDYFFKYAERYDAYKPDAIMDAIVIHVNRLRVVNELYGRDAGDGVLVWIAGLLKGISARAGGYACRGGAASFYMYIEHQGNCESCFASLLENIKRGPSCERVAVRVGVYSHVDKNISVPQRFDRALMACNSARSDLVSNLAFYDGKMHEAEVFNDRLLEDIDRALEQKQFKVYFQPKYEIRGDRPVLHGAEALVRWKHPEFGMVSPGIFVPLFEKNALILKLDRYVWREAIATEKKWKDEFGFALPVSINISRMDVYEAGLEQELMSIVRENDLLPEEVHLEITESAYTDDSTQIVDVVERLRKDGFKVEMDDFGAGYSSLNMLAAMPIDVLKLDMRFVRHICDNPKDLRLVKLMIDVAHDMAITTIAEGVETKDQCDLLRRSGCDAVQGYYFSKPLPPEEFAGLLEKESAARR